ncbi:hypothetical protein EHS25_007888 [Saitozyma podzolica]|uniref:Uncharacterized protein n=1 Tax=Saitozyma podzolica TaxID=1890683 RepID=A0A427YR33_9TREE|nr:hypothetical protein EHS25_007888 [Saitozyma podzolica]
MTLAAKIYNSHNTKERLSKLDAKKLTTLVPDKEQRKTVLNAVKGIASGQAYSKKRTRDSDLLEPLKNKDADENLPQSLEFKEILDPEALIPLTVTVNRAPVKTAWAYVVARRMGFDVQESLSIAHVYVHISSLKHALMLGNILNPAEAREAEEEISELPGENGGMADGKGGAGRSKGKGKVWGNAREGERGGSSQPWVGILGAKIPVIERPDGTWRAIQKGVAIQPSVAYLYITRAFKDYTSHVMGALKLVAASYPPDELNRMGLGMYREFKPDVVEWGQRGTLELVKVLDQAAGPVSAEAVAATDTPATTLPVAETAKPGYTALKPVRSGDIPEAADLEGDGDVAEDGDADAIPLEHEHVPPDEEERAEPAAKKLKADMTVEEYEAMLDAEDQAGGFYDAVDIFDAGRQAR